LKFCHIVVERELGEDALETDALEARARPAASSSGTRAIFFVCREMQAQTV
jgi:hypothetical protein